jgi:hypothetical protein
MKHAVFFFLIAFAQTLEPVTAQQIFGCTVSIETPFTTPKTHCPKSPVTGVTESMGRIEATYPRCAFAIVLHDGEAFAYIDRPKEKRRVKVERLIVAPEGWTATLPGGDCLSIFKDGATNYCVDGKELWYHSDQSKEQ